MVGAIALKQLKSCSTVKVFRTGMMDLLQSSLIYKERDMKKFLCGFYCEPLRWTVKAESEQDAAAKFAKIIKRRRLQSKSGTKEFVVFEA